MIRPLWEYGRSVLYQELNLPRRSPDLSIGLQTLIRQDPNPRKEEIHDKPYDPVSRHDSPQPPDQRALAPMHSVLQPQALRVGPVGHSEEFLQGMAGDVRVGTAGEGLFDLLAEGHTVCRESERGKSKVRQSSN